MWTANFSLNMLETSGAAELVISGLAMIDRDQ